ncbi:putative acetyltransferase [Aquimixticola soesokkakensis]|uniref:Putative acetyltransferase n=1 Tax=Aquimixticola soesokkakensis TaxID=1519096 RepID=A0A1Y5SH34_9RHOB|nr:GNAT family N-acetyltransferase [Aquimixticola soesokkakensis]SLN40649.1 putative acetyltransferase [Aquimixticola soesokkakensis]
MDITYQVEPSLSAEEFQTVLRSSGLAARRPADDLAKLAAMIDGAQIIVTARDGDKIVGVARSITDWAFCLYCSDLAVDESYQGHGIGKLLLKMTVRQAPDVDTHLLLSAPKAVTFYEHAGYTRHDAAFIFHKGV